MREQSPNTRFAFGSLHKVAPLALLLALFVAMPICAVPACNDEVAAVAVTEQHDCCADPSDAPAPQPKGCGDECAMHSDKTPAELPGTNTVAPLVPVASIVDPVEDVFSEIVSADPASDSRAGPPQSSTVPLHILISQYLI